MFRILAAFAHPRRDYSFLWDFPEVGGFLTGRATLPGVPPEESLHAGTILFIPLSTEHNNPAADWAAMGAESILRRCPDCSRDSIIGHGRRRKQAHDETHDWIRIRRGLCKLCRKTFTFLPPFSLPYTHYSLLARSQALRRYFVDRCSWEAAAPAVKDPDRLADPSTLRRWFSGLDSSPWFACLRQTVPAVSHWLARGEILRQGPLQLSWRTIVPFLQLRWPLRL